MRKIIKIYRITFEDGWAYVGQTKGSIANRLSKHKHQPCNWDLRRKLLNGERHTIEILSEHRKHDRAALVERKEIRKLKRPLNKIDRIGQMPNSGNPPLEHCQPFSRLSEAGRARKRARRYPRNEKKTQVCRYCKVELPASEFPSDSCRSSGLASKCRPCYNAIKTACRRAKAKGQDVQAAYQAEKARLNPQ